MSAAPSISDLFAKKAKKKIKGINLNTAPTASKGDDKKARTKDTEEDGWQEETVQAATLKVEVAGNLARSEDKKDDDGAQRAAWGTAKKANAAQHDAITEKRFPTLKGAGSNINIDDGSDGKVNIATSKNVFSALEDEDDDDEEAEGKRPKKIVPAMVQKQKGEFHTVAVQREVDKYSGKKDKKKPHKTEENGEESDEDEDEDEEESQEKIRAASARADAAEARRKEKKQLNKAQQEEEESAAQEVDDDVKMEADPTGSKAKYDGRKKFPAKQIPREEREEERIAKQTKPAGQSGKKKKFAIEEDYKPKLEYLED